MREGRTASAGDSRGRKGIAVMDRSKGGGRGLGGERRRSRMALKKDKGRGRHTVAYSNGPIHAIVGRNSHLYGDACGWAKIIFVGG